FCAVYLRETTGADIVTVTVDTGGFDAAERHVIAERAREVGAVDHRLIDARDDVYDRFVSYLVKGDVLRGGTYPVSVGAERTAQAEAVARVAEEVGAEAVAHGSTRAGNDQVRFDVAIRAVAPHLEIHAPVRDLNWSREHESAWLAERGIAVERKIVAYSLNEGLFGTTIGGRETHDSWRVPPEDAYTLTVAPEAGRDEAEEIVLGFEAGLPVSLDGTSMGGVALIQALTRRAAPHGVGRGIHVGDTILGLKGRLAFEAPGPRILVEAHRELTKLVFTRWQAYWRDTLGSFYGNLLHEGLYHDPVMRDLEAFLDRGNTHVTGDVRVRLYKGHIRVVGTRSPYSLMDPEVATYGEEAAGWSGEEAAGFAKIYGLASVLARRASRRGDEATQATQEGDRP
ncbi:MAG: argininosuccinate synthase, partial [Planctomycetota bacterium]